MEMSNEINEVMAAFVAAKAELTNPPKSANNPFFKSKYAPLDVVIDHVRPTLAKHGLAVSTPGNTTLEGAGASVFLVHGKSGQYIIFDTITLPVAKKDPQGYGSAITYAQRYALCAALGITGDPDDDGNAGNDNNKPKQQPTKQPARQQQKPTANLETGLTKQQADMLMKAANGEIDLIKTSIEFLFGEGKGSQDVPQERFDELLQEVTAIQMQGGTLPWE